MIRKFVNYDLPTFDFWFNSILIHRWIMIRGCFAIRDESKPNQNESESKIKWFAHVNQKLKKDCDSPHKSKLFVIFDTRRRIKMNRFGPSPDWSSQSFLSIIITYYYVIINKNFILKLLFIKIILTETGYEILTSIDFKGY